MKAKLHPTQNDLRKPARRVMIDLLNQQLADALHLGLQAKQAHWNVKGPHFIGLHELFDKVAEQLEEFTDDIAERAVELGGVAHGTSKPFLRTPDSRHIHWTWRPVKTTLLHCRVRSQDSGRQRVRPLPPLPRW
jgi:DNA-binding ferritin-like protein